MKEILKNKKGMIWMCATALALGILSLAVSAAVFAAAKRANRDGAETMRALALADAREKLRSASAALQIAEDASDSSARTAALAEALEELSGAGTALTQAGLGNAAPGAFDVIKECRVAVVSGLHGEVELTGDVTQRLKSADGTNLDGQYAAFGMVLGGIENVDVIASVPTDSSDTEENDRGFDGLNDAAAYTDAALEAKARAYFGSNTVLDPVGGVGFPPALVLCGENTMVAVSRSRGELLELYFDRPAGEKKLSEQKCAGIAADFLSNEGIPAALPPPSEVMSDETAGAYVYGLTGMAQGVCIGVRWDTGRVCYFNAYEYYR